MSSQSHETHPKVKRKVQVVVFTRTPHTRILLLQRPPERQSIWQPVTGNVDPGDASLVEAARRELSEETGIHDVSRIEDTGFDFRFLKNGTWIEERLIGVETPAAVTVTLSEEHVDFAWVEPHQAMERLTWDTNREGVRRVLAARPPDPGRDEICTP